MTSQPSKKEAPKGAFIYEPAVEFPLDTKVYATYQEARAGLVDRDMVVSRKYKEQQWRAMRIGAHPDIVFFARLLIAKAGAQGIPLFPHEFVRTPARQQWLKDTGKSDASPAKGPHVWGCAVDIIHSTKGWNLTAMQWELIGSIGKELAIQRALHITWGGDWPPLKNKVGWDPAHWQIHGWRSQMTGYPFMPINGRN